ncbi:type I polyketide synthase [Myxococcus landrumensis]|uniref:SDR family NAD(P)-dependent oxidoreductase n=1 Tax=Myxococcus landrumensis TaxID=2813577 RepID=A0ABX7N505_9BACT|nr:SDR family NAD(P)-dependent oxidoreductase [Myxococcus landrumus]QSQ13842.1 SDR family NAD(P)-dependent oxidoreductase [Myxococcus landrumus]
MSRKDSTGVALTPLQQALLTIEKLQQKLEPAAPPDEGDIAIIGMGCRFPGGASNPERFHELVWHAGDAVTDVPADRRALQGIHDPEPSTPGKTILRRAGFVDGVDRFDAEFFRISRREAEGMDPQQRFFLEVGWEALEDAGLSPQRLKGTRTGVFVGVHARDYALISEGGLEKVGAHYSTGVDASYIAGRLSYLLGLEGPCLAVDTACSSSLVAVHLACQSLRLGESTVAIAGGVKLLLAPHLSVFLSKAGALSPSQTCRAFDRDADGMVQGEGCGVVILKRKREALRDGDRILATIRASATNHDGASGGLTVPNVRAQESLYRLVLQRAGVAPEDVDYLEAHGTGTRLGDPIELEGVARVYGRGREPERPLWMGSVKPNIGHTEAAAGIAGLIKAVLVLQHRAVPPALHFEHPTTEFPWVGSGIVVARKTTPFPARPRPYRAAVSSFGMSGVNAHVLLEEHRERSPAPREEGPYLLPLSARNESALRELAGAWSSHLVKTDGAQLRDACFTAGAGRAHHDERLALVAPTYEALLTLLRRASDGLDAKGLFKGRARRSGGAPGVVFFMGPDFCVTQQRVGLPLLAPYVEPIAEAFRQVVGSSVFETDRFAPLLIWQLAQVELWRSLGVEPSAVAGFGQGRLAAGVVAGVITLEEAIRGLHGFPQPEPVPVRPAKVPILMGAPGARPGQDSGEDRVSDEDRFSGEDRVSGERLLSTGASLFLDMGGDSLLLRPLTTEAERQGRDVLVLNAAHVEGDDARRVLLTHAAKLYCAGVLLRFENLLPEGRTVSAPTYPWRRERYWWDGERESVKAPPVVAQEAATWDGLFHEVAWMTRALEPGQARLDGLWLVVAEAPDATVALRDALSAAGGDVVLARPGSSYERVSARDHVLDFTRAADFSRLLEELGASREGLRGVLFLPRTEALDTLEISSAGVLDASVAVAALVKALARATWSRAPRLYLVTRDAQSTGEDSKTVSLVGASVWGLGRVIAYEHPELRCTRIDVGLEPGEASTRGLMEELRSAASPGGEEDEVALRKGLRLVSMHTQGRRTSASTEPFRPRSDRTYLITGGLGGLGLRLASWLVGQGARYLTLCGRKGETLEAHRALTPLREQGARVEVFRVDVSDSEAVADMLRDIRSGSVPLGGLFHCAGVLADKSLLDLEPEHFERVMEPKVAGAWNLHTLTQGDALEHFVLFSSTASLFGARGQGNYAAANAFLDALARLRRSRGLPGVSLQWGSWSEVGMAAADERRGARLAEHGMTPLSVEEALSAMAVTLAENPVVRGIARFDVERWTDRHPSVAGSSLFRARGSSAADAAMDTAPRKLREVLLAMDPPARSSVLETRLREMVSEVSRLELERLAATDSFDALGFDSIMVMELRDQLQGELGVGLSLKSFVDGRSIGQVAAELLEKLAASSVMGTGASARTDSKRVLI